MGIRGAAKDIPSLARGNKIFPEHLASMLGLPSVGDIWYVDPGSGSDTANNGKSADNAYATVSKAVSSMTADQDDVVVLAGTSSTGRTSETSAVNWSKRRTHLVGNGPLRKINPRNGMSWSALGGDVCFTVSATNCSFTNVSFASFTDNNILVDVTAAYNTFDHCHFQGIANATTGQDATARCLRITGADETIVKNSTIGLDTVTRSEANSSLELTGVCARSQFINCDFPMFTDDSTARVVLFANNDAGQRYTIFENCRILNPILASSSAITDAMIVPAALNGTVWLDNVWTYGVTDIADNYTNVFVNNNVVATADQTFMIIGAAG